MSRYINLYSGNRNRQQYPFVSYFETPYSTTSQIKQGNEAEDPIISSAIYYKWASTGEMSIARGTFGPDSTITSPQLDIRTTNVALKPNYYRAFDLLSFWSINGTFQPYDPSKTYQYPYTKYPILDNNTVDKIGESSHDATIHNLTTNEFSLISKINFDNNQATLNEGGFINCSPGDQYTITGAQQRKILEYDPSTYLLKLDYPLLMITPSSTKYIILRFSQGNSIEIPQRDINGNTIQDYDQAYINYYIINEDLPDTVSKIIYYDYVNRSAYLDKPVGYLGIGNILTLRKEVPQELFILPVPGYINNIPPSNPIIGPLIGPVIKLPDNANTTDNYYKGKYIYYRGNLPATNRYETITAYGGTTLTNTTVFKPIYGAYYVKAYNGSTREASVDYDINNTPLPSNIIINNQYFITGTYYRPGDYINNAIYLGNYTPLYPVTTYIGFILKNLTTNTSARIIDYNPITTECWIDDASSFTFIANAWDEYIITTDLSVNICSFIKNNFFPYTYSGSIVSLNETSCYEVTLISLILPNVVLRTGSRIAFYPFVYVELKNISAPNKASNELIYTNNPNALSAVFVAPVTDIVDPISARFVKLGSSEMTQLIKFKPNDSLSLRVFMPNGELFLPVQDDNLSPYEPNSLLQITATFRIKKI